jgi:hypothetical protein
MIKYYKGEKMENLNTNTYYFASAGSQNTEDTLQCAKVRAEQLKIKNIVIPSTTGKTGVRASKIFRKFNLVVISHVAGFKIPNLQQFLPENRKSIEEYGGKIVKALKNMVVKS